MCRFAVLIILGVIAVAPADGVSVWQVFPWLKEAPTAHPADRAMMPEGTVLTQLADAEYESVCLAVFNDSPQFLSYRIDLSALVDAMPNLGIEVLSSWVTPIRYGDPEAPPLKLLGADKRFPPRDIGDPLLQVTPHRVLHVPAGECRSVWLILHTQGTPPGVYRAPVRLVSADDARGVAARADVTVHVWPFALPEKLDIAIYHWDYGCDERALRSMREHKVNTFMIEDFPRDMVVNADGTVSGKLDLDRIALKRKVIPWATFVGSYSGFAAFREWADQNGIEYLSPTFRELCTKGIRYMVGEYRKAGLGYDDYMIQTIDEAHGDKAQQIIEMGPIARQADPKVRWALTVMTNMDEIKAMSPYHDAILYRGEAYWSPEQAEWYRDYVRRGGTVWQFKQTGIERGREGVHMFNRLRTWRTWLNRWSGCATFVYSSCVYDPFHDPITVRQWEAVREGNEDYQYFAMARDLARKLGPEEEERTTKLVDDLVQGLIGPTAPGTGMLYPPEDRVIMLYPYQVRTRLAAEIARLRQANGENVPAVEPTAGYGPPWLSPVAGEGEAGGVGVRLSSNSSYEPQEWSGDPRDLAADSQCRLEFHYQTRGTIPRCVALASEQTRKDRKGNDVPVRTLWETSLPDTHGEWREMTQNIPVATGGRYRIRCRTACQQAPDAEGKARPAIVQLAGLMLRQLDRQLLDHELARVRAQLVRLKGQTSAFDSDADPLRETVRQVEEDLPRATSADAVRRLADHLNSRPFATWLADAGRLPLPAKPRSSQIAYGTPSRATADVKPTASMLGTDGKTHVLDAAPIGIANFAEAPLCFMLRAERGVDWGLCMGLGTEDKRPDLARDRDFEKRYGWCEFVVPPGETRYLWVSKPGKIELHSMDSRVLGVSFDVEIDAGLGLGNDWNP